MKTIFDFFDILCFFPAIAKCKVRLNNLTFLVIILFLPFLASCFSLDSGKSRDNNILADYAIQLEYPVVLVHGIVAYGKTDEFDNWGRLPLILRDRGIDVYFGNTEGLGGFDTNALLLKERIEEILRDTHKEKVNIIGHSKGGLDSRYLIWRYNFGGKVASLTTISTPHNGWEFADLVYKKELTHSKFGKKALAAFGKLYGEKRDDMNEVIYQLTTDRMKIFNELILPDERVFYQGFYSTMNNAFDDMKYFYTYPYIKRISGKNDGIVSEKSAQWENICFEITGGISHDEIVDVKKKKISGIDIPLIYVDILRKLSLMGF